MKKILPCSIFLLLLIISFGSWGQDRAVSGKVTSSEDGSPLPGVNVVLKGTVIGTAANADGRYILSVPSGSILVFSFIGMKTKEVEVGSRSTIDVQMELDATQLSELTITETGYNQEKRFIGASGVLGGEVIERTPIASLDQSLQGRIAGVLVNSGSGQPGTSATVRIRGVSSIAGANAQPLYVIDGVPVVGDLSGINANDIVSQTILKDASSGALYGARGANGVIVITTKKGQAGVNAIDFRAQVGISMQPPPSNFNMMNTDQALAYELQLGQAGFSGVTGPGWALSNQNPTYATQTEAEKARRDGLLERFRNNNGNYYDILFRKGVSTTNELVARGGTEASRYYTSFNVFNQDGFAEGSNFKRYTGRINIDHKVGKLSMNLSTTIVSSETNSNVGDWLGNNQGNPFQIVWRAKPYEDVYKGDGTYDFGASTGLTPRTIANAIERQQNSIYRQRDLRILGGLGLKYEIIKGLVLRNNFGVDMTNSQGMYSIKANSYVGSTQTNNSGFHTEAVVNRGQVINTTGLNYSKILNDRHEIEVGAFFEAIRQRNSGFGYQLYNLDKRLSETGQGASSIPVTVGQTNYPQNGSGAKSQFGIRSYFGTTRYTYDNRYTVNLNARIDGTSRILNDANKEIFTWSTGLGWDAINEEFLKSQNTVTDLKVRATYGEVPNIGSISTNTYVISGGFFGIPNYLGPQMPSFGTSTSFIGSAISGLIPRTPGNPNLKIETVQKYNVGFDLGLFNRATIVVDLYKNTTVDLFVNQPLSATTGFGGTTLPINAGKMTNKGIEITITGDIYKHGDWALEANWNHAININNIDDLGAVDEYQLGTYLIKKGLPFGSHYTYDYVGADPATGQPLYRDVNGIVTTNKTAAGQKAGFGTFLPKHTGGFSLSGKYKRIQLSTFFTYQFDVIRSNNVWSWVSRGIPGYLNSVNQTTELLDNQWMKPGDEKFYQSPGYDRDFSSVDLMDAKFLRFRELTISYTLPKIKYVKDVRVYGRAQNIKVWSPWKGLDPEDDNNISLYEYPNPRMFVFGVDLSF